MHKPTKTIALKARSPLMGLTDIFPDGIPVREGSPSLSLKNREGDRECWEIDLTGQPKKLKAAVEALYFSLRDRYLREAAGRGRFAIPEQDAQSTDRLIVSLIQHLELKKAMSLEGITIALGFSETLAKKLLQQLEERDLVVLQRITLGKGLRKAVLLKAYWHTQEDRLLQRVIDLLEFKRALEVEAIAQFFGFSEAVTRRFVERLHKQGLVAIDGQKVCWNACRQEVA